VAQRKLYGILEKGIHAWKLFSPPSREPVEMTLTITVLLGIVLILIRLS
jgi:hypothetical protein